MKKNKTIIIAGANGFMGSKLLADSLLQGLDVIALARNNNGQSAEQRILVELEDHLSADQMETCKERLSIYPYDIRKSDLGLATHVRDRLIDIGDAVFNLVGDTNFFPKDVQQSFATNVDGAAHMIQTLCTNKAAYNHISTAYVSGKREGVIYESELDVGQEFKNDYEKSKFFGEKKVADVCTQEKVPYNIFRPSIVIRKHSVHGKIPNLNHFYSFIGLIDILRQDAQTQAHSDKREKLQVPVRFLGQKNSTLNFVDLNYSIDAMMHIALNEIPSNKTYHLVNHKPLTNQEFLNTVMKLYNLEGFEIFEDMKSFTSLNFYERLIKRGLANYIDYFFIHADFDDVNTRNALSGTSIQCPDFNNHYIAQATGHII